MDTLKNGVIHVYKPPGVTPLELIKKMKQENPYYEHITMGYAGRLDPMAEGVMLILTGEENKKRKNYELLPKTYEMDIMFGISTDTYDGMGLITSHTQNMPSDNTISRILAEFTGTFDQPYPPYSSPLVQGKPLYYWARERKLHTIQIPSKQVTISSLEVGKGTRINLNEIKKDITDRVKSIRGEFRQSEIIKQWDMLEGTEDYLCIPVKVTCTSGTYMRSLAYLAGEKAGTGAFAYHIRRTQVGPYTLENALHLPF